MAVEYPDEQNLFRPQGAFKQQSTETGRGMTTHTQGLSTLMGAVQGSTLLRQDRTLGCSRQGD
jgi:hypothetical protein